eukprot:TRINITY_DN4621_c0_g1_i3.p1 TRINITY_DN4621_c0_g1~~TRINITY_DN4621_c0_g1_i3.p1  ORF type:complete len:163 (-),score=44.63 TRINITY_DN4621_c0_g1_i3:65-553(-)
MNLELSDATFDVVVSMFGVMMFPDPLKGLKEMARVAKKGGKVVTGTWPNTIPMIQAMNLLQQKVNSGAPKRILPFSSKEDILSTFKMAGMEDVQVYEVTRKVPRKAYMDRDFMESNPGYIAALKAYESTPNAKDLFWESMTEVFGDNQEIDQTALIAIATLH